MLGGSVTDHADGMTIGRATASVGIVANVLAGGLFVPVIGVFISIVSAVGLLIWYILIARRLFLLAQGASKKGATHLGDELAIH